MCLAIPGKILEITGGETAQPDSFLSAASIAGRTGLVSLGGVVKEVNLSYTPEARVGHYVIVHAGFAISTLDREDADQVFGYLGQMGELQEVGQQVP